MASPFAVYLYAVYGPGLDWLQSSTRTSWRIGFFLPHIVAETRSVVIDVYGIVGQVLFAGGLGGFAIGAFQIYRAKLRRADAVDAVEGGLYRYIRHPQCLALIVASIGMVLIWPRYLVLVLTVTVVFIYIALAKAEEGICLRRFPGYAGYMEGTGRFLPVRLPRNLLLPADAGVMRRVATWGLAYAAALGLALLAATGLRSLALDSLYAMSADGDTYVSVVGIADGNLAAVAELAQTRLRRGRRSVIGGNCSTTSCRQTCTSRRSRCGSRKARRSATPFRRIGTETPTRSSSPRRFSTERTPTCFGMRSTRRRCWKSMWTWMHGKSSRPIRRPRSPSTLADRCPCSDAAARVP